MTNDEAICGEWLTVAVDRVMRRAGRRPDVFGAHSHARAMDLLRRTIRLVRGRGSLLRSKKPDSLAKEPGEKAGLYSAKHIQPTIRPQIMSMETRISRNWAA